MQNKPLKYLFQAQYKDGSVYSQNEEDRSTKDEKKSAYFDVDQDALVSFALEGDGHYYKVFLDDGHFEIDGVSFKMAEGHFHYEDGKRQMLPLQNLKLVYFRQNTRSYKVGFDSNEEISHEVVYLLGWECQMPCGHTQREIMHFK